MKRAILCLSILTVATTFGCRSTQPHHAHQWESVNELIAVVVPTEGNPCKGYVRFTKVEGGVRVVAEISGLTPNAQHAFHIHEFGDATASNGLSAGGHYNPQGHDHGRPEDAIRHAGDLGNLQADSNGKASYERLDTGFTLTGLHNPIIGRSVIIHAGQDKFTQPVGDAGPRIGIGIIGVAKPADAK